MTTDTKKNNTETKTGKRFLGVVTSAKMKDTIVVAVTRYVKHSKYKKYIKRTKKYHAHDPGNAHAEGEKVTIAECRPISKTKRFQVIS